ncbi:MAG TPA: hypothetical protein PLZ75_00855 [Bacteroidales bacterium]|jgi:uncharacterized protein YxeA|nr:hypothetical protein [Bacteroidales bacterium]HQH23305.1 hypothetical protein [Bacteroidales bacterium]HQJ82209.1 hypothetical protein [Bacteroidales bacterium]
MKLKKIGKSIVMLLIIIPVSSLITVNAQELKAGRDPVMLQRQQMEQKEQEQKAQEQKRAEQTAQEQKAQEQKTQDRLRTRDQTNGENQVRLGGQTGERANASGSQSQTAPGGKRGSQPGGTSAVPAKKIQGARPDWSKAKGARPASIERPSGSRIPKGAGRPAGARGPGRR